MNKSKTNFIIDVIMFWGMMFLAGTGYVRKYILLSGSASRAVYGQKTDLFLFDFSRDDWSLIHLYTAYFLLFLLALHIILHWKQITVMYKQLISSRPLRIVLLIIFVAISVCLIGFPFVVQPTM